jgi:uncharacterized membrane protein
VNNLYLTVFIAFCVNWIAFVPAAIYQTEKYFDLTGSITYFSCTLGSLLLGAAPLTDGDSWKFNVRAIIQSCMAFVWCIR